MTTCIEILQAVQNKVHSDTTKKYQEALNDLNTGTHVALWNYAMMETGQLNYFHHYENHTLSRINEFRLEEYAEEYYDEVPDGAIDSEVDPTSADYFLSNYGEFEGSGIYQNHKTQTDAQVTKFNNLVKIKQYFMEEDNVLKSIKY